MSSVMSTNNEGPAPKSLTLESASNPCMSASTGPTPLGTLSMLPREIRDETYRHVCSTKWYLSSPSRSHCKWHGESNTVLPTMTLSKSIRQEFLAILYAESLFVICDTTSFGNNTWRCWKSANQRPAYHTY